MSTFILIALRSTMTAAYSRKIVSSAAVSSAEETSVTGVGVEALETAGEPKF